MRVVWFTSFMLNGSLSLTKVIHFVHESGSLCSRKWFHVIYVEDHFRTGGAIFVEDHFRGFAAIYVAQRLFLQRFHDLVLDLFGEVWVVAENVLSRIATLSKFVALVAIP